MFKRYLELGSIGRLLADLRGRGILTKVRRLANGRTIGGIPFTRGPLAPVLRNRFCIGEVVYKGNICPGEHHRSWTGPSSRPSRPNSANNAPRIAQPGRAPSPCC